MNPSPPESLKFANTDLVDDLQPYIDKILQEIEPGMWAWVSNETTISDFYNVTCENNDADFDNLKKSLNLPQINQRMYIYEVANLLKNNS